MQFNGLYIRDIFQIQLYVFDMGLGPEVVEDLQYIVVNIYTV